MFSLIEFIFVTYL